MKSFSFGIALTVLFLSMASCSRLETFIIMNFDSQEKYVSFFDTLVPARGLVVEEAPLPIVLSCEVSFEGGEKYAIAIPRERLKKAAVSPGVYVIDISVRQ